MRIELLKSEDCMKNRVNAVERPRKRSVTVMIKLADGCEPRKRSVTALKSSVTGW